MIDFKNVCFSYGETNTLNDLSFHINKGDFVAVLGANGAGKTTLSKLFNGILKPTSGDVTVNGLNTKTTQTSVMAKNIGFLFQNPDRQICKNSVKEEIMFSLSCIGTPADEAEKKCSAVISRFGIDGARDPFSMSRSEKQRIALASIIVTEPDVMILDEPTTGLDYEECIHIMEIVKELNEKGITVIMVTHDMELVLDYSKKVLVMNKGKMLAFDEMRKVMKNQDVLSQARLLPPQITGLAMRFDGFEDVYTHNEMHDRLAAVKG